MNSSIYRKLAFTNLKNNHKTYVPYILTSVVTVMMFYIMDALCQSPDIKFLTLKIILDYALGVILIFAVIFLFYTNSFLIKRRKKEIGVYNILGMGKRHIAKMLIVETLIVMGTSIIAGLVIGIVFEKLMYLLLLKLLRYNVGMNFGISAIAVQQTVLVFGVIFLLILVYNLMQIKLSNPIELLHATNKGEKEPKTKWLLTVIGIITIAIGYGIALIVKRPLEALGGFFVAVVCVIIGTYALFTAGSIAVLKMLKKNKSYYYQTSHFTAVSGMIYRMKQNAAGLANICILSTMVLVMVSTTFSLYMGMQDILDYRFPKDLTITTKYESDEKVHAIESMIDKELKKHDLSTENFVAYNGIALAARKTEEGFEIQDVSDYTSKNVCDLSIMALEDYNQLEEKQTALNEDEVLVFSVSKKYPNDMMKVGDNQYKVKKHLNEFKIAEKNWYAISDGYYIVLPNREQVQKVIQEYNQASTVEHGYNNRIAFDICGEEGVKEAVENIYINVTQQYPDAYCESRIGAEESFYGLYGSLLFIGIYLGVMFIMATVLIIYYKQISEGYDDRERYQIMQKVGMSRIEVKRSIRSQVLIVFFLPLITAIVHNVVAFRIVNKLLHTLNFINAPLYMMCTIVTICVFVVFYAIVYAITAREYYKIVNE